MPIYVFRCKKCGHTFEELKNWSNIGEVRCPKCNGETELVPSRFGVKFKGKGFYETEYKRKGGVDED